MKQIYILLCLLMSLTCFSGCDKIADQVETVAQQLDVDAMISAAVESIDPEELKSYAQQGYDALVNRFPALKAENMKALLKENGLDLIRRYVQSTDESRQETAGKLGQILKILYPELTDEVNAVIPE